MTDKAEMLVDALIEACEYGRVIVVSGGVNKPDLDLARSALVALIASQAAEIERLHEQGIRLAKTLIKYLPSNVRQSCDSAELWADIDGILYHD